MNLKVPGAILPLGCAILSTRAKTVRGVGTTPLRRTRVNSVIILHRGRKLAQSNPSGGTHSVSGLETMYITSQARWIGNPLSI